MAGNGDDFHYRVTLYNTGQPYVLILYTVCFYSVHTRSGKCGEELCGRLCRIIVWNWLPAIWKFTEKYRIHRCEIRDKNLFLDCLSKPALKTHSFSYDPKQSMWTRKFTKECLQAYQLLQFDKLKSMEYWTCSTIVLVEIVTVEIVIILTIVLDYWSEALWNCYQAVIIAMSVKQLVRTNAFCEQFVE